MGLHQIRKLLHSKTTTIVKRQSTEWKEIFASYSSDRRLISRIYKEHQKLNTQRTSNTIKWANEMNRMILERGTNDHQIRKQMFTIPILQEIENKNSTEIPSHPSQNGYHQGNKQKMLARM
jgi:hypothetical protein